MLSDKEIEDAKKRVSYSLKEGGHHEHNDCIRIAYEWLDAQRKTKRVVRKSRALKHLIENWAGRYVSRTDVDVAAELHPHIIGTYPYLNISSRLVRPAKHRLEGIDQAFKHHYEERRGGDPYSTDE